MRTSGLDTIRAHRSSTGITLQRETPAQYPADRPHRLTVGSYDEDGRPTYAEVLLDRDSVEIALQPGRVVVPDAKDDTWAKVRLDDTSLTNLATVLPKIEDGRTRAVIWNSLRDATADAELDPRVAFEVLLSAIPHEDSDIAIGSLLRWAEERLLGLYLPYEPYRRRLAEVLTATLAQTQPGSSRQLAITRALIGTSDDADLLQHWLDGEEVPDGLQIDTDLRWSLVLRLVRLDVFGAVEIGAELARDRSTEGVAAAAKCRAALPAGKEEAWARLMADAEVGVNELFAVAEGFWHPAQAELTAPYVERYFSEIAGTAALRFGMALPLATSRIFPRFAVGERTVELAGQVIADDNVAPSIGRSVADATDDLRRALAVRRTFG
ncbi:ERAP1-like C-terminal domain-containing protein [Kribbella qitaiheensis]|uniref:ERAP1-like C-terminal domain-containing protein n=1 Tax=Kribbella qitaiheensis TaxID=1544730 RepID=UPI001FE33E0C|nr:ERAP1-like C-terminal domain-containing protein [Kribbella qitaiheensis]